jgi:hypothetical protein
MGSKLAYSIMWGPHLPTVSLMVLIRNHWALAQEQMGEGFAKRRLKKRAECESYSHCHFLNRDTFFVVALLRHGLHWTLHKALFF